MHERTVVFTAVGSHFPVPAMTKSLLGTYSTDELLNEIQSRGGEFVEFRGMTLKINPRGGGGVYRTNAMFADCHDPVYERISALLHPAVVLDIGANIGFAAIQLSRAFPDAQLIVAEPNRTLHELLEFNLSSNDCRNYQLVDAAVGDDSGTLVFQLNQAFSADSRVRGLRDGFEEVTVNQTTLDELLAPHQGKPVFIKIDTQGYERQVLDGGAAFFRSNPRFLAKAEFAPALLEGAGTEPGRFLEDLLTRFTVAELGRSRFKGDNVPEIFSRCLEPADVSAFVSYVRLLARDDAGWTDLLLGPKHLWFR